MNTSSQKKKKTYIPIADDFSITYMNLVCLDVLKKLILLWLSKFKNNKYLL